MPVDGRDFRTLVKEVRSQLGLTQEDFARELGVSYATVNRWENGQYKPSKLAKAQFLAFFERMRKKGKLKLTEFPE